jgi:Zn finger protein HypA/HybF involved in hydrogenase expression
MRSNQSNPIDLPGDPPTMRCLECEEIFPPAKADYYGGVCPYCGFALTEDKDE